MLKIFHARLQNYLNRELPDITTGFRKGRGTRDQIANILWVISKQRNSRKTSTCVSSTKLKPLTVWIITNYGKLLKIWGYQTILPVSQETCMHVKKQVRTLYRTTDWFKIEKGVQQVCLLSPCLFNLFLVSTSQEMLGWMSYKLESRQAGEISTTSDMWMIPL